MDDLAGLDWNTSKPTSGLKNTNANYYPTLRPTPQSLEDQLRLFCQLPCRQSPQLSALQGEQQKKLEEERLQRQKGLGPRTDTPVGDQDGAFLEALGSGRTTPNIPAPPRYTATAEYGGHRLSATINKPFAGINVPAQAPKNTVTNKEEDLLSGFTVSTNGSRSVSQDPKPAAIVRSSIQPSSSSGLNYQEPRPVEEDDLDDDPFGLGMSVAKVSQNRSTSRSGPVKNEEDDILGLLGRPVSEFSSQPSNKPTKESQPDTVSHPQDKAMAELVDMGFSITKSREALESTESGTDVQAAVGWLLNQAHQESRQSQASQPKQRFTPQAVAGRRRSSASRNEVTSTERQNGQRQDVRRQNSRSPVNGEKDPAKIATEIGNNLFKTANSLWKTGTMKLNQAVSELNSDSDTNQPKWMREAKPETESRKSGSRRRGSQTQHDTRGDNSSVDKPVLTPDVTDEALMLESRDARPIRKPAVRPKPQVPNWNDGSSREQSPATRLGMKTQEQRPPRFTQQQHNNPKARLDRQILEEQSSEAPLSKPQQPSKPLSTSKQSTPQTTSRPSPPVRPPAPKRNIPPISPTVLQTSNASRLQGSEAFKRGDYGLATTHYSSALSALPSAHPLTIPILTNRALSHSKTGDPKASIADATAALALIGPSRGASETIDLGSEGSKEMSLFWGKAMTRHAEALEQLERWSEAAAVWRTCVEANVGGATSIAGRNRCEKAANPSKPKSTTPAPKRPPPKPVPRQSALDALSGTSTTQSTEAVSRLRAANLEAERVDDEKFALSDRVGERVQAWRAGKEGNLRALLASLESVLWAEAGWKGVGMGELIAPGRVKVVYMKGIAKVHPDKLPTNASTEQRMISAAVFAALNEAWDGFRRENGL
ncbi:PQ loop repeat protein [Physcia stellaris]|nr:PQ loop repeat protein [Physcia stellaris]